MEVALYNERATGSLRSEVRSVLSGVDLFAGAGGLGLGAEAAGLKIQCAVELDPHACETLRANQQFHRTVVEHRDICSLTGQQLRTMAGVGRTDPLVIIGGPPCQPFSKAAYWTDPGADARFRRSRGAGQTTPKPEPISVAKPDARRDLISEYLRLVVESRAEALLFENVPSILHPRNKKDFELFLNAVRGLGFFVSLFRANAANYGVAQNRERVFVLASRAAAPQMPKFTHSDDAISADLFHETSPIVTAAEALAGLDESEYFEPEEVVSGRWEGALREIPPGWNYKALSAWAGHPNPKFEAETRFWNFLLKLHPDRPSWTIAASPGPWTGPFHWSSRRLRTAELAALQGFPRGYLFSGSRRERVRQIGNAVPPPLGRAMVTAVLQTFAAKEAKVAA